MKKYSYEKVVCPKCGKAYAIPKGSANAFPCPGRNCHAMVNASAAPTGKNAVASAKAPD